MLNLTWMFVCVFRWRRADGSVSRCRLSHPHADVEFDSLNVDSSWFTVKNSYTWRGLQTIQTHKYSQPEYKRLPEFQNGNEPSGQCQRLMRRALNWSICLITPETLIYYRQTTCVNVWALIGRGGRDTGSACAVTLLQVLYNIVIKDQRLTDWDLFLCHLWISGFISCFQYWSSSIDEYKQTVNQRFNTIKILHHKMTSC